MGFIKRTEAHFVGGVFTNLSHDHLDYHPTFASIEMLKIDNLPKDAFVLTMLMIKWCCNVTKYSS
jgi:UDP-N-acetylmuramoyl-L-alanyl-D-glutamate--2,6-diaminopimelate ligase